MSNVSWKDVLHYGASGVLVLIGILGMTGAQLPGVSIDPSAAIAAGLSGLGILGAGLKPASK